MAAIIGATTILWLLVTVAFPAFIRGWNLSRARRIINDARQMDGAIDEWADEAKKLEGDEIDTVAAAGYLKGGSWQSADLLGNSYIIGWVGSNQIGIAPSTKSLLAGLNVDWGNY
jgi:hypothetical protein